MREQFIQWIKKSTEPHICETNKMKKNQSMNVCTIYPINQQINESTFNRRIESVNIREI